MALDGIAAVQARIQEIEQIIASRTQAASTTQSSQAPSGTSSTDFAAVLANALGSSSSNPLDGSTTGTSTTDPTALVSQLSQLSQLTNAAGASSLGGSSSVAQQFLTTALSQAGKPYVWGASASPTDPNPKAFDCSELTKWAAARVGVKIPDVASAQFLFLRDHGATIPVDQALHTPGALLFHFAHEPKNLADDPSAGHVAISVGDGVHTIEARGHAYGTNVFDNAAGRGFNYAGIIPGMG